MLLIEQIRCTRTGLLNCTVRVHHEPELNVIMAIDRKVDRDQAIERNTFLVVLK